MKKSLLKIILSVFIAVIFAEIIEFGFNTNNKILNLTYSIQNTIKILDNKYITESNDSWFKINNILNSSDYNYIELDLNNLNKNAILSVYYSVGDNLSENKKIDYRLKNGKNRIPLHKGQYFDTLRFDIGSEEGIEFNIDSLKLVNQINNKKFIFVSFIIIFILNFIILNLIDIRKS